MVAIESLILANVSFVAATSVSTSKSYLVQAISQLSTCHYPRLRVLKLLKKLTFYPKLIEKMLNVKTDDIVCERWFEKGAYIIRKRIDILTLRTMRQKFPYPIRL